MNLEVILFLTLLSPLAEAFPNLYLSWWSPTNGNLQRYLDTWPRRIVAVFTVWFPILIVLAQLTDPPALILLLGALVFGAFGFRFYFFDVSLKQRLKKARSVTASSKIPGSLYVMAFTMIGIILYQSTPDYAWLVPVAIVLIFSGAYMIGTFREKNNKYLTLDITGRIIFITGFLLNLYNILRAL